MRPRGARSGMTLIETTLALVIMAIAFYSLIAVFVTLAPRNVRVEDINAKVYLAQGKLEEYLTRGYSITSKGPSTFETASLKNYRYQIIVTNVTTGYPGAGPRGASLESVRVRVWGGALGMGGTVEISSMVTKYSGL
ncbi:MAG: type II secretion system protein [Candidatus Saganbacteria bacterium]|nr:type II secretion system protein [Candidatus Saganbacteria bacterium]